MDFQTAIRNMESDPEFAAMTYRDQVELRMQVAHSYLQSDPDFISLPPAEQGNFLEELSYTKPVFQRKDMFDPQVADFVNGINQSRADIADALKNKKWWVTTNPEGITPTEAAYKGGVMFHKFLDELSWAKGAAGVIQNGALDVLGLLPFFDGKQAKENLAAENSDRKKFVAYVDYFLSQDKRTATNLAISKSVATLGGVAVDMAGYGKLLGGLKNPVGPLGRVVKAIQDVPKVTGWVAPWIAKGAAGLTHYTMGGLIGVARENLKNVVNGTAETPEGAITLHNSQRYFGDYFIWDVALFGFGAALKTAGKGLFYAIEAAHTKPTIVSDFAEAMYHAMSNRGVPLEVMGRLPDPLKRIMRYDEALFSTLNNVERMGDVDRFKLVAANYGYMVDTEGGALNITHQLDDNFKQSFYDMDKAQEWFAKEVIKGVEVPIATLKLPSDNPLKTQLRLREVITKSGNVDSSASSEILSQIVAPVNGEFKQQGIKGFVEGYLANSGKMQKAVVNQVADAFEVSVGELKFEVPKRVTTGKEEQEVLRGMIDKLQGIAGGEVNSELAQRVLSDYLTTVKAKRLYTPGWVEQAAQELGVRVDDVQGQWNLTLADGRVRPYSSYHDVADEIVKLSTDELTLKKTLQWEHGLLLEGNATKGYELRQVKAGKTAIVDKFDTIDAFYGKYPHLMPGIDAKLGPQFTVVDDGLTEMKYFGKVLTGDRDKILKELNRFREGSKVFDRVRLEEGINLNRTSRTYEVSAPGMGLKEEFRSLADAKAYLRKMSDPYERLIEQSYRKGYRIHSDKLGYFFYDNQGNRYTAKTVAEANAILEKVPIPEYAPELVGFDNALRMATEEVPTSFVPQANSFPKLKAPPAVSRAWLANNFWRPTDVQLHALVKKGFPEEFYTLYENMNSALNVAQGKDYEFQKILNSLFIDPVTRKAIKPSVREQLGAIYEQGSEAWVKGLADHGLPPRYADVLGNMKTYYDNWYTYMGIKEPFLEQYLPKIRAYFADPTKKIMPDGDMHKQLQIILGQKSVPQDLDAFFSHARVSDVYDYALEADPLEMLRKTTTMGVKQKFVGPIWSDMRKFISQANGKKIDADALERLKIYMSDMAGIPQTNSEKAVERIGDSIFRKMNIKGKPIAKDLMQLITGWGYAVSMSWRPFSAIKNLADIYQATFRIGNTWVERAMEYLGDPANKAIFERLRLKGTLQYEGVNLPGAMQFKDSSWIAKFNNKGLALFKTVDDFNRSVAYMASDLKFQSAWERYSKKLIDYKGFVDESGIYNLKDMDIKKVNNFIQQGNIVSAKDHYATQLMNEIMPDYKAGMGNYSTKGVVGRLFGQMGHYSMMFTQNLISAFSRGNFTQKAANVGRFLVNSTALYLTAEKVLGIRGDTFLPWSPVLFSGGPMYSVMNDVLYSAAPGYQGQQSRASTFGIKTVNGLPSIDIASVTGSTAFRMLVPMQARSLVAGFEALNDGDPYSAFLSFTSAPVDVRRAIWHR